MFGIPIKIKYVVYKQIYKYVWSRMLLSLFQLQCLKTVYPMIEALKLHLVKNKPKYNHRGKTIYTCKQMYLMYFTTITAIWYSTAFTYLW